MSELARFKGAFVIGWPMDFIHSFTALAAPMIGISNSHKSLSMRGVTRVLERDPNGMKNQVN